MSCAFEEDLTAYVDGEMPATRRAEVEAHLGGCAGCRATEALLRTTEALLRTTVARLAELPDVTPSPATRRAVLAKVDALPLPWRERLRAWLRPGVLVPSAGLAAAAAVALVMAGRPGPELALPDDTDAGVLEVAANMDLVEDYELLGLDSSEDLEVVENLHELEVR